MEKPEDKIEMILGRKLRPEDEGSVPFLNLFPAHLLADARKIFKETKSVLLTSHFIDFYTGGGHLNEVKSFIEDVIVGDQEPGAWQRFDRLYFSSVAFPDVLSSTVSEILAPLRDAPGEHWVRQTPRHSHWSWSSSCGQPCVLHRSSDVEWKPPQSVFHLLIHSHSGLEQVNDVAAAVRRWMASRVAWQLAQRGITLPADAALSDVMAALSVNIPTSADAEIAIRGLLREEREFGPSTEDVPGFRGPDEWYTV